MAKVADKYLKVDPWAIIEEEFDPERNRTSESIFSLGNEYHGRERVISYELVR
jgi:maltose phosphorylase